MANQAHHQSAFRKTLMILLTFLCVSCRNDAPGPAGNGETYLGLQMITLSGTSGASVAVDQNARTVVGLTDLPSGSSYLQRFNSDLSADVAFGAGGRILVDTVLNSDLFAQDDGSTVIADYSQPCMQNWHCLRLRRYDPMGNLDSTFAHNGVLDTGVLKGPDYMQAPQNVQMDGEGRFVVSGTTAFNPPAPPVSGDVTTGVVFRFTGEGTLDTTFANQGVYVAPKGYDAELATVTPAGAVRIMNQSNFFFGKIWKLLGLDSSGRLDSTFSGDTVDNTPWALRTFPDGSLLVSSQGPGGWYLYRFRPDGSRDTSFGGSGVLRSSTNAQVRFVDIDAKGRVLVASDLAGPHGMQPNGQYQYPRYLATIARYTSEGIPDSSFGSAGIGIMGLTSDLTEDVLGLKRGVDGRMIVLVSARSYDPSSGIPTNDVHATILATFRSD